MNRSFYSGVSGVKTQQFGMDIWSNNIANVNNSGFKASRPEFASLFAQSIAQTSAAPTSDSVGLGGSTSASALELRQGALLEGGSAFDMALEGDGWFSVAYSEEENFYTRDGSFALDAEGNLTNSSGFYVQGVVGPNVSGSTISIADELIPLSESMTNIQLTEDLNMAASATTEVELHTNLDPEFATGEKKSVGMDVVSAAGERQRLLISFTKVSNTVGSGTTWDSTAEIYDTNGNVITSASGVTTFDELGALTSNTLTTISGITINMGTGTDGMVSFKGSTQADSYKVDGHVSGDIGRFEIDEYGQIIGVFTNGKSTPVARVGVMHFQNDQGLSSVGNDLFRASANSGEPFFYTNASGELIQGARVLGRKLEASNVDLSVALTELIVTQKAFDANAKSITTSDQLLQTAIEMKR
jgi:flagellar hook protein FlgE